MWLSKIHWEDDQTFENFFKNNRPHKIHWILKKELSQNEQQEYNAPQTFVMLTDLRFKSFAKLT